jgi:hypothetical protein
MARRFLAVLACLSWTALPAIAAPAQFKGMIVLSKELSARIAPPEAPIDLDRFMPADGLDDLTGSWSAFGTEHTFENGQPNAVNMVLLRLAFSRFAASLAASCVSPQLVLNEPFFDIMDALCSWPSAEAMSEEIMMDYWLAMMGYNAPKAEYTVWRDFIRQTYRGKDARATIEAMTLAIMLNPYFLLQR